MAGIKKLLIVGGGIAGLSAAITLLRDGHDVDLIERDPEWGALGAGLTINGATIRAFRTLGLMEEIIAAGHVHGTSRVCDINGKVLVESSNAELYGPGIPPAGGILRPTLHKILKASALAQGLKARVQTTVEKFDQTDDHVTVTFSDAVVDRYDFVLGADGLSSQTRRAIFPNAPAPCFTGQGCWRALASRPPEVTTSELYLGGHSKAGINPISAEQMYLFVLVSVPKNPWHAERDWLKLLKTALAEFGGHIGTVRDHLGPNSKINYRPLETLVMPPPWSYGNILLVGDAAHATTPHVGYGAGLAVEDAVVLAELLRLDITITEIFTRFVERRYARCRTVVDGSIALGQLEIERASVERQSALSQELYAFIRQPA